MVEIKNNGTLRFSFPEVHRDAILEIDLKRTLRVPDDGRLNLLPPNLGTFEMVHVRDYSHRVPDEWVKHGGVMLPMFQSEAMWIRFHSIREYPFAIKVASGKCCALTGEDWTDGLAKGERISKGIITNLQNYLWVPKQPWLDGFNTGDGEIRQFVAEPMGEGITVKEQLTGEAKNGGLQIQVFPLKRELWLEHLEEVRRKEEARRRRDEELRQRIIENRKKTETRSWWPWKGKTSKENVCECRVHDEVLYSKVYQSVDKASFMMDCACSIQESVTEMGLAAGGRIKQEIYADPHALTDWDMQHTSRVFLHLLNAHQWDLVTHRPMPHRPFSARDYRRHGFTWYDYWAEGTTLTGSEALAGVKSVAEWDPSLKDADVDEPSVWWTIKEK